MRKFVYQSVNIILNTIKKRRSKPLNLKCLFILLPPTRTSHSPLPLVSTCWRLTRGQGVRVSAWGDEETIFPSFIAPTLPPESDQSEASVATRWPIRGKYCGKVTNQRPVLWQGDQSEASVIIMVVTVCIVPTQPCVTSRPCLMWTRGDNETHVSCKVCGLDLTITRMETIHLWCLTWLRWFLPPTKQNLGALVDLQGWI